MNALGASEGKKSNLGQMAITSSKRGSHKKVKLSNCRVKQNKVLEIGLR